MIFTQDSKTSSAPKAIAAHALYSFSFLFGLSLFYLFSSVGVQDLFSKWLLTIYLLSITTLLFDKRIRTWFKVVYVAVITPIAYLTPFSNKINASVDISTTSTIGFIASICIYSCVCAFFAYLIDKKVI